MLAEEGRVERDAESLRQKIGELCGESARVIFDSAEQIICLIPRAPTSPITIEFYDDGWLVLRSGAHVFFELTPTFDNDTILGIVQEIVDGRCEEVVLRDDCGALRICTSITLRNGGFAQAVPEGEQFVKWKLPAWTGESNDPEVTLCDLK